MAILTWENQWPPQCICSNCVTAPASTTSYCSKIADIAFVIDSSSSIWPKYFDIQIRFIHDILDLFDLSPGKTRVAAVSFSNITHHEFNFNQYKTKADVLGAIDKVKFTRGDATRTYEALEHMNDVLFRQDNGARSDVVQIAVVLTDGVTNPGGQKGVSRRMGKVILTVLFVLVLKNYIERIIFEMHGTSTPLLIYRYYVM